MSGILGQKSQFKDVFTQDAELKNEHAAKMKKLEEQGKPTEDAINSLNDALSGKASEAKKNEEDLKEMERFSKEDIDLASQLLFNGFARKTINILPTVTATFMSLASVDASIINDLMFDLTKVHEKENGVVDMPQKAYDMNYQNYTLAMSLEGYNGKDICERSCSLEFIKNGCKKLIDVEVAGEVEKHAAMLKELKNMIRKRTAEIRKLPAVVIDALHQKRYEFEREMFEILTKGNLLPKS